MQEAKTGEDANSLLPHSPIKWHTSRGSGGSAWCVSHRGSPEQKALDVLWALNRGGE